MTKNIEGYADEPRFTASEVNYFVASMFAAHNDPGGFTSRLPDESLGAWIARAKSIVRERHGIAAK